MAAIQIRDPVHGFLSFDAQETALIDSPVLQRLRGIRQLAMASLVFPGALHTRFDHTLGVAHLVGRMAESLAFDSDERRLVRFAALLHDVGHGPFSHVSETSLERFADRRAIQSDQKKEKIHEMITARIIGEDPRLERIIGRKVCDDVIRLLSEGVSDPAIRAVVSGPLDADKQDYLLRDSYFCGVDYGTFDYGHFHRSLVVERTTTGRELMIRSDGVHAVEQFVLAKYYMTTMVYRHKVRLITDQMIVRAIELGIERDGLQDLRQLYGYDGSADFVRNYLGWDDARFMLALAGSEAAGGLCNSLLRMLRERRLLKRVFSMPVKEFDSSHRDAIAGIGKPDRATVRREIESAIAECLESEFGSAVTREFVILHSYQVKSARESARNDEAGILVHRPGGASIELDDESTLFASIDQRFSDQYTEVYAPVQWRDHAERDRRLAKLAEPIRHVIEKALRAEQERRQI